MSRRRRLGFALLLILVGGLIALRLMLPEMVRGHVNERISDLNEYSGYVEDIDISLWRGAFSGHGIEVVKKDGDVPAPFMDIPSVDVSLSWRNLFRARIVARVVFHQPVFNFVDTQTEDNQFGEGTDWRQVLQDMVPIEIDHVGVRDGRLHFRNFASDPPVDLEVSNIQATITNLTNADRSERPQFAEAEGTGEVLNQAEGEFSARFDPLGDFKDFELRLRVDEFDLTRLNDLTEAYANFDFRSGTGSILMELEAVDAQLSGYFRPLLDDVQILDLEETMREEGLLSAAWEGLVAAAGWLFRNHPEDRIAAQVEIRGDLDQADISGWQAFLSVLRNAFVEAYQDTFDFD